MVIHDIGITFTAQHGRVPEYEDPPFILPFNTKSHADEIFMALASKPGAGIVEMLRLPSMARSSIARMHTSTNSLSKLVTTSNVWTMHARSLSGRSRGGSRFSQPGRKPVRVAEYEEVSSQSRGPTFSPT